MHPTVRSMKEDQLEIDYAAKTHWRYLFIYFIYFFPDAVVEIFRRKPMLASSDTCTKMKTIKVSACVCTDEKQNGQYRSLRSTFPTSEAGSLHWYRLFVPSRTASLCGTAAGTLTKRIGYARTTNFQSHPPSLGASSIFSDTPVKRNADTPGSIGIGTKECFLLSAEELTHDSTNGDKCGSDWETGQWTFLPHPLFFSSAANCMTAIMREMFNFSTAIGAYKRRPKNYLSLFSEGEFHSDAFSSPMKDTSWLKIN